MKINAYVGSVSVLSFGGNDFSFEDYGIEGDGIVANLTCSSCGATADFYIKIEE